jgi:hypothetical protein
MLLNVSHCIDMGTWRQVILIGGHPLSEGRGATAQRLFLKTEMNMKRFWTGCFLLLTAAAASADPAAPPTARELHSAQCVAALEVSTESLAAQVKAGSADARGPLQSRLEAGTALVGDAYLQGTRDEARARALANQALEDQKSLGSAELAQRQEACADEGQKLLAASNGFERAIVRQLAKKRMAKLLAG